MAILSAAVACMPGYVVVETPRALTLEGRLASGRASGDDCLWLVDRAGRRVYVFWPTGWDTKTNPGRLIDPSGHVVASDGDVVIVAGPESVGASMCSADIFTAETVQVVHDGVVGPRPTSSSGERLP